MDNGVNSLLRTKLAAVPPAIKIALAAARLLNPSVVVTPPIGMVLVAEPVDSTLARTRQLVDAPVMKPPLSVMVLPPGLADAVPPQLLNSADGLATVTPAGRLSVNPMPLMGGAPLAVRRVTVRVSKLVVLGGMVIGAKVLPKEMGSTTARVPAMANVFVPAVELIVPAGKVFT